MCLAELHQRYQFEHVEFLVDDIDYLVNALTEDGYRFGLISRENRNAVERVF